MKILAGPIVGYPFNGESTCVPLINIEQLNPPMMFSCRVEFVSSALPAFTAVS